MKYQHIYSKEIFSQNTLNYTKLDSIYGYIVITSDGVFFIKEDNQGGVIHEDVSMLFKEYNDEENNINNYPLDNGYVDFS